MKFEIKRTIANDPQSVWKLVSNFAISPGNGIRIEEIESGDSNGKNCVRNITFGKTPVKERIVNVDPGKSFEYSILEGAPVKYYTGRCRIEANGTGTNVYWSGDFKPKIPLSGFLILLISKKNVRQFLDALSN